MKDFNFNNDHCETAILGSLLLDNTGFDEIGDQLHADDFSSQKNREIYQVISKLLGMGKSADIICVSQYLADGVEENSDAIYVELCEIANSQFSPKNIKYYVEIVKQKSIDRKMVAAAQDIMTSVKENKPDRLDYAQKRLSEIADESVNETALAGEI